MTKFRALALSLVLGLSLVGCSSSPKWQEGDCEYYTNLSNNMAELAYEADLSGDTKSYEYYRQSYENIAKDLPEICK
jgi:hypothetical protein